MCTDVPHFAQNFNLLVPANACQQHLHTTIQNVQTRLHKNMITNNNQKTSFFMNLMLSSCFIHPTVIPTMSYVFIFCFTQTFFYFIFTNDLSSYGHYALLYLLLKLVMSASQTILDLLEPSQLISCHEKNAFFFFFPLFDLLWFQRYIHSFINSTYRIYRAYPKNLPILCL